MGQRCRLLGAASLILAGAVLVPMMAGAEDPGSGPVRGRYTLMASSPGPPGDRPAEVEPTEIFSLRYGERVVTDIGTLATAPLRWEARDWALFTLIGGTTAGLAFADHGIRHEVQKNRGGGGDTFARVLTRFGDVVPAALIAGFYLEGYALNDSRAKRIAADGLEASLIAGGLTYSTKFFTGRSRPFTNRGADDFRGLRASGSFPSFHTTEAFAMASVISAHADSLPVSIAAYSLAAGVGYARMRLDRHFLSDVFLGAAIGTVIGHAVVKLHLADEQLRVSVGPMVEPHAKGVVANVQF